MFNLLVSGSGWKPWRDTFPRDRVLEYTSDELEAQFMPNEELDVDAVLRLPTLFMPENGATDNDVAYVGSITRLGIEGRNYVLTYTYDSAIQPLPNGRIEELATDLGIDKWEFSRTHWAIKDADLFYTLLVHRTPELAPRVFTLSNAPVDGRLISVMMPFDAASDNTYALIATVAQDLGMHCRRADDIWKNDAVIQDVVDLISTSKVVVCDLSGRNSNVFYEIGIAHTIGKHVILITQSKDDVPFNLRHLRFVLYLNNAEGRAELAERLRERIKTLDNQ